MDDQQEQQQHAGPPGVGTRLRDARVAAGLSLDDLADRTKIAVRNLTSIENDRFGDLAGKTYAVGFSRTYARAVGLDQDEIAAAVRRRLEMDANVWSTPRADTFEPGDPARVPPARLAWLAWLGVIVVIVVLLAYWQSYISPAGSLPDIEHEEQAAPQAQARSQAPAAAPSVAAADPQGQVVFTALEEGVWAKFYDADGKQLFQKEMAKGETYAVPADARGPMVWTARPDALGITVGGREVSRLAETPITIKDQPVTAQALAGPRP